MRVKVLKWDRGGVGPVDLGERCPVAQPDPAQVSSEVEHPAARLGDRAWTGRPRARPGKKHRAPGVRTGRSLRGPRSLPAHPPDSSLPPPPGSERDWPERWPGRVSLELAG